MTDSNGEPKLLHKSTDNPKMLIANVKVFDGENISPNPFIVIDGDKIGADPRDGTFVDGQGGVLIPGLIDSHVHLHSKDNLEKLRKFGVTTCLDMECFPPELLQSLRNLPGLPDVFSAGYAAYHNRNGEWPAESDVPDPKTAEVFVAKRVAEGADFIKTIADPTEPGGAAEGGGIDEDSMKALVAAAKQYDRLTVAHAMEPKGLTIALNAGIDILTHAPLVKALDGGGAENSAIARIVADKRVVVPTLTMMEGIDNVAQSHGAPPQFENTRLAVEAMHKLNVPILAGTDCNEVPTVPVQPPHGESLHHELELLVSAGLSTVEALRAATVLPAKYFRLPDRGSIAPGMRADLVLLSANPLEDIKNTRSIQKVWLAGQMFDPAATA